MNVDAGVIADEVEYPTSDGKPMAETDAHRNLTLDLIRTLQGYYADRPDVYVSGNLFVYYDPANKSKVLAPDCFVVRGVPNRERRFYKTWEEGKGPEVVIELTSKSTRKDDQEDKLAVYRDVWGVEEYFLFDPYGEYLSPQLQGYRWHAGEFIPIEMTFGQLWSGVMGLYLEPAGRALMLFEMETNRRLYPPDVQLARDEYARRAAAERERDAERIAREQAEAEVARLRAELDALRRPPIA